MKVLIYSKNIEFIDKIIYDIMIFYLMRYFSLEALILFIVI